MTKTAVKKFITLLFVAGFALSGWAFSQEPTVYKINAPEKTLENRLQQGFQKVQAQNIKGSFWIGYSISKLMPENVYYFSWNRMTGVGHWRHSPSEPTLQDLLQGRMNPINSEQKLKEYTQEVLNRMDRKEVPEVEKKISVLFKQKSVNSQPQEIYLCSLDFPFELDDLPLIWLGEAEDEESLKLLWSVYQNSSLVSLKEDVINAVGMHEASESVIPLLESVLNETNEPELREEAASELGDHSHQRAVELLLRTAMQDQNLEVREEAASALEDIDLPESVDALITIARKSPDFSVKEEAVESLGEKAVARVGENLSRLASEETETVRLQKIALEALE
ncbi:MAG: hypothetical protein GF421_02995, partial [Candidatus Aminicenantes bacterium]|nr:hypothetical protein [Candidatus Aminicenantes bacterium]